MWPFTEMNTWPKIEAEKITLQVTVYYFDSDEQLKLCSRCEKQSHMNEV